MHRFLSLAFAAAALAASSTARANLIVNGSLESAVPPAQPDNLVYVTPSTHQHALTGWTLDSGAIDIVPKSYFASSVGNYSVDLVGTPGLGSISQRVGTSADTQYTLSFDLSFNPEQGPLHEKNDTKILRVVALGADGVTILFSKDFTGTGAGRSKHNMDYHPQSFSFTADGAFSTIRLLAVRPDNRGPKAKLYTGPVIDNLDLEIGGGNTIPEPASLGFLGIGIAALLTRRRRHG